MLDKEDILRGFGGIDALARQAGVLIDLSVYRGAAMALAFDLRQGTRDVDAVVRGNPDFLRSAAARVAEAEGWPADWLNDGVKGFTSAHERMTLMEAFAGSDEGGLRIHVPTPEYLFAMKCMAMRPEGVDGSHDISDIEALADIASIADAESALALIEAFYPASRIPPKVWDAGSARLMASLGAEAVATTSSGVAWAHGYPDGDALPIAVHAEAVRQIARVIDLPLTVDAEGGYADEPAGVRENLARLIDAGPSQARH